jgi:DNA-binding XRE family transcriptional regulator
MRTKRLTLESFKSIVKKIIKEEMYRNPQERSSIVQNDRVKSLELSKGTIEKIENGFHGNG